MEKEYGIIILAAGQSSRLGRPKQSLLYREERLLGRMVKTALAAECGPVLVVLGAGAELFVSDCAGAATVVNTNWQRGMASSICCGIDTLLAQHPSLKGAILSVCDQPYITAALFQQLAALHRQTSLPIIASEYDGIPGTPVFFHCSVFPELLQLEGDKGAKHLLQQNKERVGLVSFPQGKEDIDTEEDYHRLLKNIIPALLLIIFL